MKTFALLASAALVGLVNSQAGSLPQCAQQCVDPYFSTSNFGDCGLDAKCICSNNAFLDTVACCLAQPGDKGCPPAQQSQAVNYASQLCAGFGVTVPASVTCKTTSSSGGSPSTSAGATPTPTGGSGASNGTVNQPGQPSPTTSVAPGAAPRETGLGVAGAVVMAAAVLL